MSNEERISDGKIPILRLRPTVPTELIRPRQQVKQPDGPWIAHPYLIDEETSAYRKKKIHAPDITMKEYRDLWKEDNVMAVEKLKGTNIEDFNIVSILELLPSIHMQKILGRTDHEIASRIERHYVGAHQYLDPGHFTAPILIDRFGADWGSNARDGLDWDDEFEESRRTRARSFLKHALDNEKWNKSEYAWEADAWNDVFSLMRDDPALSVDKHEYNTIGQKVDPVSCLLTGESRYIKRIPDATFGLATFQPRDYQNVVAEWDLDRDRLEALLLHQQYGLISDPRWGETSLVFPFAVYEAKGWSGDARAARRQACSAGKVYLDLLDNLARQLGKAGEKNGRYQTDQSRNSQVFVYTSFGAHWHVLVGYKRPRLAREHAGHQGLSESVYVFQRIWSSRVTTERRAWELLSLVDQIHLWGVTDFRDSIMRHLKPWHDFAKKCYINDIDFMEHLSTKAGRTIVDGKLNIRIHTSCTILPEWTKHFTDDARLRFKERVVYHLNEKWPTYRDVRTNEFPYFRACGVDGCGALNTPGYPLATTEDIVMHLREVHGWDDAEIAEVEHAWETGDNIDNKKVSKRSRR
ncbi:hypothetical protein F5883DRAFT_696769 [Diaporthe sp. PMI_573]|nr:hypothetical protein F5883DRAFT_696769 [Diaporthaceae sp. PMI_573]